MTRAVTTTDFAAAFDGLKRILEPFADRLRVRRETAEEYTLETPYIERWKRELQFGSVQVGRSYVSFHLMPVYVYPDLLDDLPARLRKRMQGKSCFNFREADPELFEDLEALTRRAYIRLEEEQVV